MKIKIDVINEIEQEESTVEIDICGVVDYHDAAMKAAVEEANEQGWDTSDIKYQVADIEGEDDDYIIELLDELFVIEEEDYNENIYYDLELSDSATTLHYESSLNSLIKNAIDKDCQEQLPTLIKAVYSERVPGGYYNQAGSGYTSTIIAYRIKK